MSIRAFDVVTRRAAATVSRRQSLLALGGAALGSVVARPGVATAKKGGESCGKKQKKKCNQNKGQCIPTLTALCAGSAACLAEGLPCCDECFSATFLTCLIATTA